MPEKNVVKDREWCGYRFEQAWPPKEGFPLDFNSILKWIDAKITKSKLVWLRDIDGVVTLAVARKTADGELYAARYWPGHRLYSLRDNGCVFSFYPRSNATGTRELSARDDYVVHWLPLDRGENVYMYMKNYDTYNKLERED